MQEDGGLDALELTAGSSLLNPLYLFRGDAPPIKEFANAFKPPPLRWGIRMSGKKFLREYPPYREAYLMDQPSSFARSSTCR